jgi:hypothetical protein
MHCVSWVELEYDPVAEFQIEILFQFYFFLNLSLNFENSYLSVYCSKNYETSFVGFIISRSMHKEYQIE